MSFYRRGKNKNITLIQGALLRRSIGLCLGLALAVGCGRAWAVKITAKWDANPPEDPISGYELHYDIRSGPPYAGARAVEGPSPIEIPVEQLADPAAPELELHGFPSCHPLHFNMKAYRDEGDQRIRSDFSGEISAKVPYRPQWIEVEQTEDGRVVARWDSFPSGDEGTIARFRVYFSTAEEAPDAEQIATASSVSVPLVDLASDLGPEVEVPGLSPDTRLVHLAVATECATGERRVSEITTVTIEPASLPSRVGQLGCRIAGEAGGDDGPGTLVWLLGLWLVRLSRRGRASERCGRGRVP